MTNKFHQILPKTNKLTLTSNVLQKPFGNHPIVLFKDENNDFFYLKCRTATFVNKNNEIIIKKSYPGEVLINKSQNHQLFWNDTYVDTTHLYRINANEFFYLVNKYHEQFEFAHNLSKDIIKQIFSNLINNFDQIPPNINFIDVSFNKQNDHVNFYTQYANINTLNFEYDNFIQVNSNKPFINEITSLKDEIMLRNDLFLDELISIKWSLYDHYKEVINEYDVLNHTI